MDTHSILYRTIVWVNPWPAFLPGGIFLLSQIQGEKKFIYMVGLPTMALNHYFVREVAVTSQQTLNQPCRLRLQGSWPALPATQKKLAEYLLANLATASDLSITELGVAAGVSEGTVVKLARRLGYRGYQELRLALAQEAVIGVSLLPDDGDDLVRQVFRSNITSLEATLERLDPGEVGRATEALNDADQIEFFGCGTSALIAAEASYKFTKLGRKASAVADTHIQAMRATLLRQGDVAFGISHSGRSYETIRCLQIARETGATTICLTNYTNPPILRAADIQLVTASYDTSFHSEPMASIVSQLSIIQALFLAVLMKDEAKGLEMMRRTNLANEDRQR
jgi:DNA-binding MurR/RpiR family transcriptional regulator